MALEPPQSSTGENHSTHIFKGREDEDLIVEEEKSFALRTPADK